MTYTRPHSGSASDRFTHRAFTLIEILVVVSIIAILVAILIPALAAAKAESETVACLANQRTIAQSLIMFAHQHNGYMVKGMNNGYIAGAAAGAQCDGPYYGSPQIWAYGAIAYPPADSTATGTGSNWDQVLISDKYITPSVLRDPADTTGNVRYPAAAPKAGNTNPVNPALNVPASYRLNASNQPEDISATAPYTQPLYNAYTAASVNAPSQSIIICDGGYDAAGNWKQTPDVATWASAAITYPATGGASYVGEEFSSPKNPNTPGATDSAATPSTSNINTTIHSGEFNVAFLDGHCKTMKWADTWAPAGQPTVVPASSGAPAWAEGGTGPVTTGWRQVFSQDYQDK